MKKCQLIAGLLALAATAVRVPADEGHPTPAASAPCQAPEYRQFDFWIGAWRVTEPGKAAGNDRVERILDGCALAETWTGSDGMQGRSLSMYDSIQHRWRQTWVDDRGSVLELEGGLRDGSMVLEGVRPSPQTGKGLHQRITWTANPDETVRQHWEQRREGVATWVTAFDGVYSKER